jgi:hypothetical protein
LGEWREGIALLARAIKFDPENAVASERFFQELAGSDRTIFPASDVKIAEWVDNALVTNPNVTEEWVRSALVLLPDQPLLHIALAGFETDSKGADFLRSFGLARLPKNSIICTRAGEMLLAQDRPKLALDTVDQALLADPTDLSANAFDSESWTPYPVNWLHTMPTLDTVTSGDEPRGDRQHRYKWRYLPGLSCHFRRCRKGFTQPPKPRTVQLAHVRPSPLVLSIESDSLIVSNFFKC